ncbi:hypothetical protein [Rhizobium sullae]|uniref:Uncharacterized protein n=1 Tax=Rhizobium sullae TaxID=50338 RepID=A0A2N0D239_RHISU|nr:hypothetical protein [Rhizobium sullae]PKA40195.1 hypothetical protein CWR43_26660 [Rhizobium sullae]UWU14990.1 hypothetical protein N2599_02890 [Rhizobium sullae]
MLSSETPERPQVSSLGASDPSEAFLPMELLELELSLEGYDGGEEGFCEAVRAAAANANGEFLFDLPAAGLIEDCRRLAVLRIPSVSSEMRVVLAVLDRDGSEIRVQAPDEETEHLVQFADAFIEVLERI